MRKASLIRWPLAMFWVVCACLWQACEPAPAEKQSISVADNPPVAAIERDSAYAAFWQRIPLAQFPLEIARPQLESFATYPSAKSEDFAYFPAKYADLDSIYTVQIGLVARLETSFGFDLIVYKPKITPQKTTELQEIFEIVSIAPSGRVIDHSLIAKWESTDQEDIVWTGKIEQDLSLFLVESRIPHYSPEGKPAKPVEFRWKGTINQEGKFMPLTKIDQQEN